jgi:hypothetical protein
MSEDRAADVRRAREVLNGAGWVFDKYRGERMAVMLSEASPEEREAAYVRARIVTEIQAELQSVVDSWDYDTKVAARREAKDK